MADKYNVTEETAKFLDCLHLSSLLCSKVQNTINEHKGDEIGESDFLLFAEKWCDMQTELQDIAIKSICKRMNEHTGDTPVNI